MALNYKRFSEEEVANLNVIPAGDYDFYVSDIVEKKSRGGLDKDGKQKKIYDMLVVTLRLLTDRGERQLRDWIMIVQDEEPMGFKLRHFAATCGSLNEYDNGTLETRHFVGRRGRVKIGIKDIKDEYNLPKKLNAVVDYIAVPRQPRAESPVNDFLDDDVPNFR